jgi:hypothetical protein
MTAGWGTGKTMCAIFRAVVYSKGIPNNLGIIFRKTFRSLEDSTLKDFEKYTGMKVPSNRDVIYPNGSIIMFRHLDELESINQQNINLGFYYIEQGDELDSDNEFFMLFGRLRRAVEPTEEFLRLGLSPRSGWVIANAGDHWIKKLWKDGKLNASAKAIGDDAKNFTELIEATTWDNKDNLPKDFLDSLPMLEKTKPEIYKQFVMNDWSIGYKNKVFPSHLIDLMKARQSLLARHSDNAGVSVDPAGDGKDDNVFYAGKGGEILEKFKRTSMSPSDRAHQAIKMCKRVYGSFIIVDCDGVGIDTWLELDGMDPAYLRGIQIIKFHGSAKSEVIEQDRPVYQNMRAEAAFVARARAIRGVAGIEEEDVELIEDLVEEEFFTNNRGLIQLEPKEDIAERLGRSPGCGDAFKMLQYGFEQQFKRDTTAYDDTNRLPAFGVMDDSPLESNRQLLPAQGVMD